MIEDADFLDDLQIRTIRIRLLSFFDEHRREMPWRGVADPYRTWVSEVMLQQTRVETVVPYYLRWMERFPTLQDLAEASIDDVLRLWQGLGYYSRARNLHRAARKIRAEHGGRLPDTVRELETLPGIGKYTAGAVASIAFGRAEPAVDGNVRRVLARLMDDPGPGAARLRRWAAELVDPDRPGDFNQALMELGSLVCGPRDPDCNRCPLADLCQARAAGTQLERPAPKSRPPVPQVTELALLTYRESGGAEGPLVLLRRRPPEGLLGGMWEVPSVRFDSDPDDRDRVAEALADLIAGLRNEHNGRTVVRDGAPADPASLPPVRHAFSHRRMTYLPHVVRWSDLPVVDEWSPACRWIRLGERDRVALPVAQQEILESFERWVKTGESEP